MRERERAKQNSKKIDRIPNKHIQQARGLTHTHIVFPSLLSLFINTLPPPRERGTESAECTIAGGIIFHLGEGRGERQPHGILITNKNTQARQRMGTQKERKEKKGE